METVGPPVLGKLKFGVPSGGAFDRDSYQIALALARSTEPVCLELGMAQVDFEATAGGTAAVVGAPVEVEVGSRRLESNRSIAIRKGETLRVTAPRRGARVYVAWGSGRELVLAEPPSSLSDEILAVSGPQGGLGSCFGRPLSVSLLSNRVGVRLEGSGVTHGVELPSEPQCIGAVQVTSDGTLIVLGPDGPTIGGYPKLCVIIDASIDRVGQLRPGEEIVLSQVDLEGARKLSLEHAERLGRRLDQIRLAHGQAFSRFQ